MKWSPVEVQEWLKVNGFSEAVAAFQEREIDGQQLVAQTQDDVEGMGCMVSFRCP